MLSLQLTRAVIKSLDWIAHRVLPPGGMPGHLRVGVRGEEDAYFHLRKKGYVIVSRNFRSPVMPNRIFAASTNPLAIPKDKNHSAHPS